MSFLEHFRVEVGEANKRRLTRRCVGGSSSIDISIFEFFRSLGSGSGLELEQGGVPGGLLVCCALKAGVKVLDVSSKLSKYTHTEG